jgi:hypothetical protein
MFHVAAVSERWNCFASTFHAHRTSKRFKTLWHSAIRSNHRQREKLTFHVATGVLTRITKIWASSAPLGDIPMPLVANETPTRGAGQQTHQWLGTRRIRIHYIGVSSRPISFAHKTAILGQKRGSLLLAEAVSQKPRRHLKTVKTMTYRQSSGLFTPMSPLFRTCV